MTDVKHHQIETNGISMHVAEAGAGRPVLFCHGFPELWYSWRHQLNALSAAGFRAIAPDQTISTVAGICGESGYDGDGGSPTEAHLKRPYGIELADGVLYIADTGNQAIRSVVLE